MELAGLRNAFRIPMRRHIVYNADNGHKVFNRWPTGQFDFNSALYKILSQRLCDWIVKLLAH